MIFKINSLEELPHVAKSFLDTVGQRKIFAFDGKMGAGKTTFIIALLKAMGVKDSEGSPTYSLVNTYDSNAFGRIHHFDLYRLDSEEEAYDIGIEEMLYGNDMCFIEWPKKINGLLPENTIWVYIRINESLEREIEVNIDY